MISKNERDVLIALREFPTRERYSPSIRDIADAGGIPYATAYRLAQSLTARGYVDKFKINGKNPNRFSIKQAPEDVYS